MEEQLNNQEQINQEMVELRKTRKNNRFFVLFLIIDLIIVGLIVYEIIALVNKNQEAAKAAEEAAENVVEQIKFLI